MKKNNIYSPLIVDADNSFVRKIKDDPHFNNIPPFIARCGRDAQILMSDPKSFYSGIFVNSKITNTDVFSVIRYAHIHHIGTPIFIIYDDSTSVISDDDLKKLAIHNTITKPVTYSQMVTLVNPMLSTFDADSALQLTSKSEEKLNTQLFAEDNEFVPISAARFLYGNKSFFDIYIKLGTNKYVKLVHIGEVFEPKRLSNYIEKGIKYFYFRKEAQLTYLSYCDHLAKSLLNNENAPTKLKAEQTLNLGNETIHYLQKNGVSKDLIDFSARFVTNVQKMIELINTEKSYYLKEFMADLSAFEHAVGVTAVASLIIRTLGNKSERIQEIVGLAGFLHDIGMYYECPDLDETHERKFNEEDWLRFVHHPEAGADILREISGIDDIVIQAVEQHHERRNGKGFPNRIGLGKINLISEVIGISEEFVNLIVQSKKFTNINPVKEITERRSESYSHRILTAFEKVFSPLIKSNS